MDMRSKSDLRKLLLSKRRQINSEQRSDDAKSAADLFAATDFFKTSTHIAGYYPMPDEFDCLPIIKKIWAAHKSCYLPRLVLADNTLDFVMYHQDDTLQLNKYQISEPSEQNPISLNQLDIVLCPLVGFDLHGNRLGMGAGYYDRTFEKIRNESKKCYLIGLAYEAQQVSELPKDPWDLTLAGIITEKRVIIF